jgi:hypothetical protein
MIYTDTIAADMERPRIADAPDECYKPGYATYLRITDADNATFRIRCKDLALAEAAADAINAAIGAKA